tara:strand:- start:812 stop:1063 length:252 start_codon:yes stop_codon:yes gene_type:complete
MKKIEKGFYVDSKYRSNILSSTPGGSVVTVHIKNNDEPRAYDNIKHPKSYIQSILDNTEDDLESIYLDGEPYWESKKADGLPF